MANGVRRRAVLAAGLAVPCLWTGGREAAAQTSPTPILFLHGNGDTAALWMPTIWRFESNGYLRARLFALDLRYPSARSVDDVRQPGRSSAEEATRQLAQEVARIIRQTGAARLVLVGQSRGGNIVRNYVRDGGASSTQMAILCGAPSHGIIHSDTHLGGSEFNGTSAFLRRLNAMPGEVVAGVPFVTILSDSNDKFAQPDGRFIGLPGVATGIAHGGPALRGANNIVLRGADHRETGFSQDAFIAMYQAITGKRPATLNIISEVRPELTGRVTGWEAGSPTNIGLAGARVRIYPVHPQTGWRRGPDEHDRTTAADGVWGPFIVDARGHYEIEVIAPGYPITHIYRPPFLRGSEHVHLRPVNFIAAEAEAGAVVVVSRPRGYFDFGVDPILLDDRPAEGEPGVPSLSVLRRALPPGEPRSFSAATSGERIAGVTWPKAENRITLIEFND